MKKLDDYLEKAIENIHEDREITRELLDDVVNFLSKNEENHKVVGLTAAKYVETLQRSNEQLVKLASLLTKKEGTTSSLSSLEKSDIYDLIKEEE